MGSRSRFSIAALLCAVLLSGCRPAKPTGAGGPPVVPVSIAKATQESIPVEVRAVGAAEPFSSVQVRSQVAGQMLRVGFQEGENVAKDQLLFEIDARPFREALKQAEAAVARDRAQLRQSEAALARDQAQQRNGDADAKRYAELWKAGIIARSQYDQVQTQDDVYRESARASQAAIESASAALQSDLSAVDRAKLDIGYCEIRAPLAGRTGNLLVHAGNLVKANDVPLVVINQVSPIFVSFSVPEEHLGAIRRLNARRPLAVRVTPQDNPDRAAEGRLAVIDNTVDTATGTIHLKASFDNRDSMLWPGEFVNATLTLETLQNATVVPAEAVQAGQQGQFLYVVKPNQSVEPRIVTVGRQFGRKMVIQSGVTPGEVVVTDGQLLLFPGARVRPVDLKQIEASAEKVVGAKESGRQ